MTDRQHAEHMELLKTIGLHLGQIAVALNRVQVLLAMVIDDDTPPVVASSSAAPAKAIIRTGSLRTRVRRPRL